MRAFVNTATPVSESTISGGRKLPSVYWLGLLVIPILGAMAFAIFQPIQVLPRISLAPGFSFVDQHGERLTSDDMRGNLTFYTFMHTSCEEPCPNPVEGLKTIESVVEALETDTLPVEYVAISFDPENDTPERLAQFAESHGVDTERWHFVTGDERQLKNVIGAGFGVYYEQADDGTFKFDPRIVFVDGWGIRRAVYRTESPPPEIIERDLNLIMSEFNNSEGLNRIAYEAAHLFLCYPD
jgi:protein SCO1/2